MSAVSVSDTHLKSRFTNDPFFFTLDSASQVHVLKGKDALRLLVNPVPSDLDLVGVSGDSVSANAMGNLLLALQDPVSGSVHHVDFGIAHGLDGCPLNLLSLPLLFQAGAIAHFEPGNCYFQVRNGSPRIPFAYSPEGMFQLMAALPGDSSAQGYPADFAAGPTYTSSAQALPGSSAEGYCFATSASLKTWHRRLGHLSARELARIHKLDLVDGFKVSGPVTASCRCDTCRQARLRRVVTPRKLEYPSEATFVGHTISTDTKDLPYLSFRGDRYVMIFVDHFSRRRWVYLMSSKNESASVLRRFLADMARLGIRVVNIQSDRGSEYFEQEGESRFNRGRQLHEFNLVCEHQSPKIEHIVQPVEMKEKLAESCWLDLFRDVNGMLWEARLSPAFWADACVYAVFLHNIIPNTFLGGMRTPDGVVKGTRQRWDRLKVFGCDVYEVIPNDQFKKYRRKMIFLGFDENRAGFKL